MVQIASFLILAGSMQELAGMLQEIKKTAVQPVYKINIFFNIYLSYKARLIMLITYAWIPIFYTGYNLN